MTCIYVTFILGEKGNFTNDTIDACIVFLFDFEYIEILFIDTS